LENSKTKLVKDELKAMKIKENEKENKDKKLIEERDSYLKSLKITKETLEAETKKRS
jgi:hypothetical protein